MANKRSFYGSREVAESLGIRLVTLQMWLSRNPEYRPRQRISGDDLLWSEEDIERVKLARAAKRTKI